MSDSAGLFRGVFFIENKKDGSDKRIASVKLKGDGMMN